MLSKPDCGWSDFKIDTFVAPASYITDVPNDCLIAFAYGIKNHTPVSIEFDAEGWEYTLVSNEFESYVIICKDEPEIKTFSQDKYQLANELVKDITDNFDEWIDDWDSYLTQEEKNNSIKNLTRNLNRLKRVLKQSKKA